MPTKKKSEQEIVFPERYYVFAADLSLRRPGFCRMLITTQNGEKVPTLVESFSVDNKTAKKTHGEMLNDIYNELERILPFNQMLPTFYVREHAFNSRGAMSEIGIFEVVGLTNWYIWNNEKPQEWHELYPVTIKKMLTGSGKSDKIAVQNALTDYIGEREYQNDDESDAAAVAVAFLIQNKQFKEVIKNAVEDKPVEDRSVET